MKLAGLLLSAILAIAAAAPKTEPQKKAEFNDPEGFSSYKWGTPPEVITQDYSVGIYPGNRLSAEERRPRGVFSLCSAGRLLLAVSARVQAPLTSRLACRLRPRRCTLVRSSLTFSMIQVYHLSVTTILSTPCRLIFLENWVASGPSFFGLFSAHFHRIEGDAPGIAFSSHSQRRL